MWRPEEGWENPNPCLECEVRDVLDRVCDMTCMQLSRYESKEAGADAILEALREEGRNGTFFLRIVEDGKGKVVVIKHINKTAFLPQEVPKVV